MGVRESNSGEVVGAYRIVRKIGEGGMGDVYEAWDDQLKRRVAIKLLNAEATPGGNTIERFRSEARILARLRHPNIAMLYGQGEFEGAPYMAMEFVDGMTVDEFILHHPCSLQLFVDFFRQMLEGLGAAHTEGIVHRDLKPQNIIVGKDLKIKIIDFGIAKDYTDHATVKTQTSIVMGTPHYFAPEQVVGGPANPQTDLFAIGLVFHFMLNGEKPFDGPGNLQILEKIRTTDLSLHPRVASLLPASVKTVVTRLTKRDPAKRYLEAREAAEELDAVDMNEVPAELCVSPSPRLFVANSAEVRRFCQDENLSVFESRFVTNLAIEAQQSGGRPSETTQPIDVNPAITISEKSLYAGLKKYRQARSRLVNRSVSVSVPVMAAPPVLPYGPRWRNFFRVAFVLTVMISTGYLWFQSRASSGVAANASVTSPKNASKEKVAPSAAVKEATKPAPVLADLPDLRPGAEYRVRTAVLHEGAATSESEQSWELAEVKLGATYWLSAHGESFVQPRDGIAGAFLYFNEINRTLKINSSFSLSGDASRLFPLREGNSTTFGLRRTEEVEDGREESRDLRVACNVGAPEKIKVPAGFFDAVPVICEEVSGNGPRLTLHYSAKIRHWVRVEASDGEVRWHKVIAGYSLASP